MYDFASGAVNPLITTFASKNWQDIARNSIAMRIAPTVYVDNMFFHYKKFADTNAFSSPIDTSFPASGDPVSVDFGVYDQPGVCQPQALKTTILQSEKDAVQSGTANSLLIEQDKIATLQNAALLAHEKYVYDVLTANAPDLSGQANGNWDDQNVDPTTELDKIFLYMTRNMGKQPNLVFCDLGTFIKWRNNKNTIARNKFGISMENLNASTLIGWTCNPACQVIIGTISRSTVKANNADKRANKFMGEGNLYVMYSNPNPSLSDESAFKNFMVTGSSMSALRSYMHYNQLSWGHNVYWNRVVYPTNATYGSGKIAIT